MTETKCQDSKFVCRLDDCLPGGKSCESHMEVFCEEAISVAIVYNNGNGSTLPNQRHHHLVRNTKVMVVEINMKFAGNTVSLKSAKDCSGFCPARHDLPMHHGFQEQLNENNGKRTLHKKAYFDV